MMVSGGVVGARDAFGIDVDHSNHREGEVVVEGMFDPLGGFVSSGHGEFWVDGDRGGDMELMPVPADLEIGDGPHPVDGCDDGFDGVDELGFDRIEEASGDGSGGSAEKPEDHQGDD
jgi:hypothetical protein